MNHNMPRTRIAVAAQDLRSRTRLTAAVRSDPSLTIIEEVSDDAGLFSLAQQPRPDLLIVDLALANRMNGTASFWSSTRIILLANTVDREHVMQVLRLRARGIVTTTTPPQAVLKGIRAVLADEYWLNAEAIAILLNIVRQLLVGRPKTLADEYLTLTERELSVVAMIAGGCSNKQIGQELSISERTVKHHLTNIFEKLGVSSRLQLANLAAAHGLVADMGRRMRPRCASERPERGGDQSTGAFLVRAT